MPDITYSRDSVDRSISNLTSGVTPEKIATRVEELQAAVEQLGTRHSDCFGGTISELSNLVELLSQANDTLNAMQGNAEYAHGLDSTDEEERANAQQLLEENNQASDSPDSETPPEDATTIDPTGADQIQDPGIGTPQLIDTPIEDPGCPVIQPTIPPIIPPYDPEDPEDPYDPYVPIPTIPEDPDIPDYPDDPDIPDYPDDPTNPSGPTDPFGPYDPTNPHDPSIGDDHTSDTSDHSWGDPDKVPGTDGLIFDEVTGEPISGANGNGIPGVNNPEEYIIPDNLSEVADSAVSRANRSKVGGILAGVGAAAAVGAGAKIYMDNKKKKEENDELMDESEIFGEEWQENTTRVTGEPSFDPTAIIANGDTDLGEI